MRKRFFIVLAIVLVVSICHAQKGSIKGVLKDSASKHILSLASVTVFTAKDTSIITYRLSDPTGTFQIPGIPQNILCRMLITFQGYKVYRKEFMLTKEAPDVDFGTVYMTDDPKAMDEVLIIAERPPMSMRNDTLEFNANAFKTLPSALVEDLLKKLPGVDVDLDGNITVKGRRVNRLLVDGKEFFGGDHKVATRNLPANIVDKVQVVDDKEELDRDPLLTKDEVGQVINIKLKRAIRQGWFGKAYAGGGTDNRHEAGAIVNLFRDTMQISVLAYSNNVNKPGFGISDIQQIGGFNRSGSNSMSYRSDGGFEINGTSFGATGQGIQTSKGGGVNFNNQYGKKLTTSLQYFYGQINSDFDQLSNNKRFLKDTVLSSSALSGRESINRNHRITGTIIWKADSVTSLTFRPGLTLSTSNADGFSNSSTTDNFKGPVNKNDNNNTSNSDGLRYTHTLSFNKSSRKKRGRSLNVFSDLSINNDDNNNYSDGTYTFYRASLARDSAVNQYRDRGTRNIRSKFNFNYTEPLSKSVSLSFGHSTEYLKEKNRLDLFDMDLANKEYTVYNDPFSNGVERQSWRNTTNANLSYRHKKLQVSPGIIAYWLNSKNSFTKNPAVNQQYFFLYPSLNINWNGWRLSYRANIQEVQASYLQRVIDISGVLFKQYGNPNLQPSYDRSVDLSYFKFNQKSGDSYNFSINSSFTTNATVMQTQLDSNRVTVSRPVNVNGNRSLSGYFFYNRQYKFNKDFRMSLRPNVFVNYRKSLVLVNGAQSEVAFTGGSLNFSVTLNYKDIIELNQRYGINLNQSRYEDKKAFRDINVVMHNSESEVVLRWPKHLVWESQVAYNYNPQVGPGIRKASVRWNAGINYVFLKEDKAQIKLSAYDLLNQAISVYRYTSENAVSDIQTTTLRRYFLLSFIYNIRNFSSGAKVGGKDRTFGFW
jgi:hypothetical protein